MIGVGVPKRTQLTSGTVWVSHFKTGDDQPDDWWGPLIEESDHLITIDVQGKHLMFEKSECIITHGGAA